MGRIELLRSVSHRAMEIWADHARRRQLRLIAEAAKARAAKKRAAAAADASPCIVMKAHLLGKKKARKIRA